MIKALIIFTIIIAMLLLYQHLMRVENDYTSQLIESPQQEHFSHQFKAFTLTNTDANGKPQSVIHSPSTRMLTSKQVTLMDDPELIMQQETQEPIIITAKSAKVSHLDHKTLLNDKVKVIMNSKNQNNIVMTTEQLTINNMTQHASTDLPATIVHSKGNMHGTGVEFNPQTKKIKFLSNVRGIYEQ